MCMVLVRGEEVVDEKGLETDHFALRPQKRDGLLGTGTGVGEGTKE